MGLDFLNTGRRPLDASDLDEAERIALAGDTVLHQLAGRLLIEVRRLQHELADPQFQYAGGRVHRHAVVCRNAEIDALREQVRQLRAGGGG